MNQSVVASGVSTPAIRRYVSRMRGAGKAPARPSWSHVVLSGVGGLFAIGMVALLTQTTGQAWLMAPFGASCVLAFGVPDSPLAQPRNIIGGHVVSTLVGLVTLAVLGAHWWSMGLAVGLAIIAMQATRTTHPPAGANPLLVMVGGLGWGSLLTPVLFGAVVIVLCAVIFNNLSEKRAYPKYWL